MTQTVVKPEPSCYSASKMSICFPGGWLFRVIRQCSSCQKRRHFVVRESMWTGTEATCCACGSRWYECGTLVNIEDGYPPDSLPDGPSSRWAKKTWSTITTTRAEVMRSERAILNEMAQEYREANEALEEK